MTASLRALPPLAAVVIAILPAQETLAQSICGVSDDTACVPADPSYRPDADVVIPVVFHVIMNEDSSGAVTDDQIEEQMAVLNAAFVPPSVDPPLPRFTFVLAGVSRVVNDDWFMFYVAGARPVLPEHRALVVEPEHVLNVYTIFTQEETGVAHYFPWELPEDDFKHGISVDYGSMPGGGNPGLEAGDVLIHEVGHYLGLVHLRSLCDTPQTCGTAGDCVCDTPAVTLNQVPDCQDPPTPTGCGVIVPPAIMNNYMHSQTSDLCRTLFTRGQYERMIDITGEYRPSLGEPAPVVWSQHNTTGPDHTHTYPAGTTLQGADVYVLPGATLHTPGPLTLESPGTSGDPAHLFVGGAHTGPRSAVVAVREGARYTVRFPADEDSGTNDGYAGTFSVAGAGSRLVADVGATLRLSAGSHVFATDAVFEDVTDALLFPGLGSTYVVESGGALAFAPGRRLDVYGAMYASGATFTERDAGQGWSGIRFNAGSGGAIASSFVERVGGSGTYAVSIYDASPTISITEIGDTPDGLTSGGVYVSGSTAFPVLTDNFIRNLTGAGVTLNGSAKARLVENIIELNTGRGLTAGYDTEAFLSVALGADPGDPGNIVQSNTGYGIYATSSAYLTFGYSSYPQGGYHADGFNTVATNGNVGLAASGGGRIAAGNTQNQRKNRLFGNAPSGATPYDAAATGGGSRVWASCDWWGLGAVPPFRIAATGGGIVDASWYLVADPYVDPNAACIQAPAPRLPGGSVQARGSGTESGGGGDGIALGLLLAGAEAAPADPAAALTLFAEVVAGWPEDPAAPAALAETGLLVTQANAAPLVSSGAAALLETEAEGDEPALQAAALQALTAAHHRDGDVEGALAAAEALVAVGDSLVAQGDSLSGGVALGEETLLFGHVAQVYLLAEAGRLDEAGAALAAVEALAPGSIEAELARQHLEAVSGVVVGTAGVGVAAPGVATGAQASATGLLSGEALRLEPARPNPARGSSGGAVVPFVLSEAASVRLVVYDVLGREVAVLADGAFAAGRHVVTLDAGARLAPGAYLVRAVATPAGNRLVMQTQRVTILR